MHDREPSPTEQNESLYLTSEPFMTPELEGLLMKYPGAFELLLPNGAINHARVSEVIEMLKGHGASDSESNQVAFEVHSLAADEVVLAAKLKILSFGEASLDAKVLVIGDVLTTFGQREQLIDLINELLLPDSPVTEEAYFDAAMRSMESREDSEQKAGQVFVALIAVAKYYGTSLVKIQRQFTQRCLDGEMKFDAADVEIFRAFGMGSEE